MVEHNYLQIKDYDSLDFDTGEVTNQLAQNGQKIKNLTMFFFGNRNVSRHLKKYMIHCAETPMSYLGNYRVQN